MASAGDAALTHLAGIEAASDGSITGFSFTGLSPDYPHLYFKCRVAYHQEFWYPYSMRLNMGDGSIDTNSVYNRGLTWGYAGNHYSFGDSLQSYATVWVAAPTTDVGASDQMTDGTLGMAEGTIWNYSDSGKNTAISYTSSCVKDGAISTYPYRYWGWAHYKTQNVVDQIQIQYPSVNLKEGSRMDIWGWAGP